MDIGDRSYAALEFLHRCQTLTQPVTVITRLRLDAAWYTPTPAYSGVGRPRKKGARLPTPPQVLTHSDTRWTRLTPVWYAQAERLIEVVTINAVWFHYGLPAVPIRYLLIRDVAGLFEPQALLTTDPALEPDLIFA